MSIKRIEAIDLVSAAIGRGVVLTAPAYNREGTLTVGPYVTATDPPGFASFWYKRRSPESRTGGAYDRGNVAAWFVDRVGRGEARKAVERAQAKAGAR